LFSKTSLWPIFIFFKVLPDKNFITKCLREPLLLKVKKKKKKKKYKYLKKKMI